jgi:tRNA pseudouridine synthase 10
LDPELVRRLVAHYPLCDSCLGRQFSKPGETLDFQSRGREIREALDLLPVTPERCYLCEGLSATPPSLAKAVARAAEGYEFTTFLVGTALPARFLEREDELRAEFKLRGGPTLKSQLAREVGQLLVRVEGWTVSFTRPDITFIIKPIDGGVEVKPRPLHLTGRYVKLRRGIPQKARRCRACLGKGCSECGFTGRQGDSIQSRLEAALTAALGAEGVRLGWLGGEDTWSLVLGYGRPFYAKVTGPRRRRPPALEVEVGSGIHIKDLKVVDTPLRPDTAFKVLVEAYATSPERPALEDLDRLVGVFRDRVVTLTSSERPRPLSRRVWGLQARRRVDGVLAFRFWAEGGLSIYGLIRGYGPRVEPSFASVLGLGLEPLPEAPFDVLEVVVGE